MRLARRLPMTKSIFATFNFGFSELSRVRAEPLVRSIWAWRTCLQECHTPRRFRARYGASNTARQASSCGRHPLRILCEKCLKPYGTVVKGTEYAMALHAFMPVESIAWKTKSNAGRQGPEFRTFSRRFMHFSCAQLYPGRFTLPESLGLSPLERVFRNPERN